MKFLRNVYAWLRGGTAGLSEIEMLLVSLVLDRLDSTDAQVIRSQLGSINIVQRPQPGRMTIMFYSKPPTLLENRDYEACLAEVTYNVDTGRRRKVRLMVHSGYLQSIQGRIPTLGTELYNVSVSIWPDVKSRTPQAIDRLEHS